MEVIATQLFYVVGVIVLMIFAFRVMKKVEDPPEQPTEVEMEEDLEEANYEEEEIAEEEENEV